MADFDEDMKEAEANLFKMLDMNADGGISRAEFQKALGRGLLTVGPNRSKPSSEPSSAGPSRPVSNAGLQARGLPTIPDHAPANYGAAMVPDYGMPRTLAAQKALNADATAAAHALLGPPPVADRQGPGAHAALAQVAAQKAVREKANSDRAARERGPGAEAGAPVCSCGNVFLPDAVFCRKCGVKRSGAQFSASVPQDLNSALAEAEQRVAAARQRYAQLSAEGQSLRQENTGLKEVVGRARLNAERCILKKKAENVQLLAVNADLQSLSLEGRRLAEQKAKLQPPQAGTDDREWQALEEDNKAIRRSLAKVLARPERMPLGGTMDSPRSQASLSATPRIDIVQELKVSASSTPAKSQTGLAQQT